MTWVDYAILAFVGLSAVVSLLRGFVREALSLAGWVLAFWVALTFTHDLASHLVRYIAVPSARLIVAFVALFLATLIVAGLVNYLAGQMVDKTGLSGTDRVLGSLFGVARGAVIVGILVLLAGLTPVPRDGWWQESVLIPHFQDLALWIRSLLPPHIAAEIKY